MQCASSFRFAVYLYYIVHLSSSLPLALYENESDNGRITEIDSSKLNAAEESERLDNQPTTRRKDRDVYIKFRNHSVEEAPTLPRNKRNFDYSDYYSSSSEEGNNFGYVLKPYFGNFWKYRPTSQAGYQLWHVQPSIPYPHGGFNYHHHHHPYHHHDKNCRYPFDSNEPEDGNSNKKPGFSQNSNGKPQLPQITTDKNMPNSIEFTSSTQKVPPSTTSTTPTTTTTITTTTEYVPIIDIRSTN